MERREQIGEYTDQVTANANKRFPPLERHYITIPEVFAYIREFFEWNDPLSRELWNLPIEQGSVFAFLPVGFNPKHPTDIKWDHESLKGRRDETYDLAVRFVSDYLRSRPNALGLFPAEGHKGDPIESRTTPCVFQVEPTESSKPVCLFLTSDQASEAHVVNALREARHNTFLGVLTTLPEGWSLRHVDELPAEQARILARATQYLVVDAFDGMAHFIWSKDKSNEVEIAH